MTPRIAGVDLGLAMTGLATVEGTVTIRPPGPLLTYSRHRFIVRSLLSEFEQAGGVDVVVLEDYAPSVGRNRVGSLLASAELGGYVRVRLEELEIPFVLVPPTTLKKFATGRGNAQKAEVFDAARALACWTVANYDEADAYFLRRIGLVGYGRAVADDVGIAIARRLPWPSLEDLERR